ncbi:tetratricopeptide repeat protein [Nocardioides nanhaiensis]|uniref:ATP-binding protein n=1 Tax=Nocardioides nanhaiensis TaxID=1476871 RepID=A0ABP8WKY5_9ACTN
MPTDPPDAPDDAANPLLASLQRAVEATPDDVALRLHLADLLVEAARGGEAVAHLAAVLQRDPGSSRARELMATALAPPAPAAPAEPDPTARPSGFDWQAAESDLGEVVAPMFAESSAQESEVAAYDVEGSRITLADVGGMKEVKKRLNAAFLAPMRNAELRQMYRKSLRGGLLLYGPPGVGKTFIARALAGELGAGFMTVSMADVLDMYVGNSEKNVHELFETARASAPVVLFLDEVDSIGHKRSRMHSDHMRSTVNQLLLELDSVASDNEGVFVLAATNHPWDVDAALRRPGRLDRTLLVLPPDLEARLAIWESHLRERPVAGIDVKKLAKATDGYTGADIAHLVESAAEIALLEAAESGTVRMIGQADIEAALRELRPSVGPWFETARNVALFANDDGSYDELLTYLRKHRKL